MSIERQIARCIYVSGSRGDYRLHIYPHLAGNGSLGAAVAVFSDLHLQTVPDYAAACALVRAMRAYVASARRP